MAFIADRESIGYPPKLFALKRAIVERGIPLIELQNTKPGHYADRAFGYWDVVVWDDVIDGSFEVIPRTRWYTTNNCYIEYFPNDKGIRTAFLPDDEFWHNRVMLASNMSAGEFKIVREHFRDEAPLAGTVVSKEIEILFRTVHMWRVQVKIDRGFETIFESKKRADCEICASEYRKAHDGAAVQIVLGKTPEVRDIIARHGVNGWATSAEWQNGLLPKIKQDIVAETAPMRSAPEAVASGIMAQIDTLSQAQRDDVLGKLLGNAQAAALIKGMLSPATAAPTAKSLDAISDVAQMRELARRYNLKPGRKSIEDLRNMIKEQVSLDSEALKAGGDEPTFNPPQTQTDDAAAEEEPIEEVT